MGDHSLMELGAFQTLRRAVQTNAAPPTAGEVAVVAQRLREMLISVGSFDNIEVETTDDPDGLVIGMCQFKSDVREPTIVQEIERIWEDGVRYPFWAAHSIIVDAGHVELEGATRASATGHYATVHLVAQAAVIPAQRESAEDVARDTSIA